MSSILIFDLNKRNLLFKVLTNELKHELSNELSKTNDNGACMLNDDFLNSYFSPLVSSFEISREIDYVYETLSFNENQFTIRFSLYENCLILCIYQAAATSSINKSCIHSLLNDYHTNWIFKCIVSLIRYKYSICTLDVSLDTEFIEQIFQHWLKLNSTRLINFFEAIEYVQVNEETKYRAELFIREFLKQMSLREDQLLTEDEFLDNENEDYVSIFTQNQTEIDDFFNETHLISHALISYEDKIIVKYKFDSNNPRLNDIDSSSLFMLLLEASNFVDCQRREDDDDRQSFKSTHSSFELKIDSYQTASSFTPIDISSETIRKTPVSMYSSGQNLSDFKRTKCFLKTKSKIFNFYEVLFIKLNSNLCFTLLKNSRLSRYCEVIVDLNEYLNNANEKLTRIRLNLSQEFDTKPQQTQSEVKFLGYFINKLLNTFEKLQNFRRDFSNGQTNVKQVLENRIELIRSSLSRRKSPKIFKNKFNCLSVEETKQVVKLFTVLQNKINQLINLTSTDLVIETFKVNVKESQLNDSINTIRKIEMQINAMKMTLQELTKILFLTINYNKNSLSRGSSSRTNEEDFMVNVKYLFKKTNFSDYVSFIELKSNRNISISYYWHLLPGLIHFSFINRQENLSFIPSVDSSIKFNCSSNVIDSIYRRYYPTIIQLLQKFDCTQFQFVDSKLKLIVNYFIWFEDKNQNAVPLDLNLKLINSTHVYSTPGITLNNYYENLKQICYPNAPTSSLYCYELLCIHSASLSEEKVKDQCEKLVELLLPFRKIK